MVAKVGIDKLAVYTSHYALDLAVLAQARSVEADKYQAGLGQYAMSVPPPGEDIVTLAANAAYQALQGIDVTEIEMLLFATESGIDQSKAAGMYLHRLLGLSAHCRVVELKQACYAGTAAIQLALPFLRENQRKKILIIAADIARYGLNTTGESSQGAGAAAILLSANPRLLVLESEYGIVAEDVMDFWRPNYRHEALVDGKYSSRLYLTMLEKSWMQYKAASGRQFADHAYFCYHTPVPRLVEKAHQYLMKLEQTVSTEDAVMQQIQPALEYGRQFGNSYTAALYISLASLLDHAGDLTNQRIGFYSYGSGCMAEYFSGIVQPGYKAHLNTLQHKNLLSERIALSYAEYETFYQFAYAEDGSEQTIPLYQTGLFRLSKLQQHKRIYEKVEPSIKKNEFISSAKRRDSSLLRQQIKVLAPGKLILSGEHAVVYGQPALAMAINRYVTTTVTQESLPQILLNLVDLAHSSELSFSALRHLKDRIKRKYHRFMCGDYSIRDVLQKPFELAQVAIGIVADALHTSMPKGVKIDVHSDLPIGCGLGSSAATILCVMQAVSQLLEKPLPTETLFQLALEAENLQHGHSSGLDLRVAMQGGCLYATEQSIEERAIPNMPFYLINTGTPQSSTGQCVERAAPFFKNSELVADFAAVTHAMDQAIQQGSWQAMREAVQQNHQLLVKIGVVPSKVKHFISEVEASGGAAKICGAGAIEGEQAGAVLVLAENKQSVAQLSHRFGYNVIPISGETRGIHAA